MANIAGAEALNRRRTLIEITHQGRPEAPSYAGAEEVLGLRDSTDGSVVDPAIAAYAAKRQAAKAEIAGWPLKSRGPPMQQMTRRLRAVAGGRAEARPPRMRNEQHPGGREGAATASSRDFSVRQFSQEPRRCFGDVFPLPIPAEKGYSGPVGLLRSRRSRQRVSRRRQSFLDEVDTISALNVLAGFDDRASWPGNPINQAQFSVLSRVRAAHQTRPGPPESESSQAALRQLLAKRAGYSVGPGALASYVRERVSLPRGQGEPVQIADLLPPEERYRLENFQNEMLLSSEEAAGVIESGQGGGCHLDPVLARNPEAYHQFIHDLHACNLIGFTDKPKIQVGHFVATKKGEKRRLIVDARPTNRFFRAPPSTLLGSGTSFAYWV